MKTHRKRRSNRDPYYHENLELDHLRADREMLSLDFDDKERRRRVDNDLGQVVFFWFGGAHGSALGGPGPPSVLEVLYTGTLYLQVP